jgi:hypothetical protein
VPFVVPFVPFVPFVLFVQFSTAPFIQVFTYHFLSITATRQVMN